MPYYRVTGEVPRKRHIQFRRPDGGLYAEELMGEEGFSSDSSLLYHVHLPTAIVKSEGVDLPAAEVAIVVSGTGTVRESVQRLGRILRPGVNKQAVLYELVTEATTETYTSDRRREHSAYR